MLSAGSANAHVLPHDYNAFELNEQSECLIGLRKLLAAAVPHGASDNSDFGDTKFAKRPLLRFSSAVSGALDQRSESGAGVATQLEPMTRALDH